MNARTMVAATALIGVIAVPAAAKESTDVVLGLAADRDAVWASMNTYEVVRVDPEKNVVTRRASTMPAYLTDLSVGEGGVWGIGFCGLANCRYGVLMRFDPTTGKRTRPFTRLGANPRAIAAGGGYVWVLSARRLLRIDPSTGRLAERGPRVIWIGRNAQDVAVGGTQVWVTTAPRRGQAGPVVGPCRVVTVDARSGRVWRRERVPCTPRTITFGFGQPWTNRTPGVPRFASDLATGLGRVWGVGVRNPRPAEFGSIEASPT